MGMVRCESDWSVYHRLESSDKSITATTVDDILLASNSKAEADQFTNEVKSKYALTNNRDVTWLLGCRITHWHSQRCLKIDQEQYVTTILESFNMANCNSVSTPMISRLTDKMCPTTPTEKAAMENIPYKQLVGKLMYLATCT
jgi:hypothetical protein